MVYHLYDITWYTPNLLAIQTLLATLAVLYLGVFALIRERGSRVSIAFLGVTLSIGVWLFAFSWMYSAVDEHIAFQWAKAAYLGVAFVPAAVYHFSALVLPDYEKFKGRVPALWTLSALFLTVIITTDMLFGSLYRYRWGFYPKYNVTSIPFLLYFFAVMIHVLRRFWTGYRLALKGSTYRMQLRALLVAFAIGYLASVDFLPAFGIPLYPFGYISIFLFTMLSARSIVRYRFLSITPGFAARQIIDTMNDALLVLDREGLIRLVNKAACTLFGHNEQNLLGMPVKNIMVGNLPFVTELESLVQAGMVRNHEVSYNQRDNTIRMLNVSVSIMQDKTGGSLATVVVARDITDQKRAEEELRKERDAAQKYLDVAGVILVVIDASLTVKRINRKGCEILGYREEEIIGKNWFDNFLPEREREKAKAVFTDLIAGKIELREYYENPVVSRSGEERIIAWHNAVLKDDAGTIIGTLSSGEDITMRKEAERQIQYLAYYDSLTGLPNRTFYKELVSRALLLAQRHHWTMAILFIDLDNLKRINDTLGHDIGDQLLRAVGDLVKTCIRKSDFIARSEADELGNVVSRLGGDEFIVLLNEIAYSQDASRVARRIHKELARPFTLAGHEVFVTASIGIALYPLDGTDAETLLKNADVAMYHAKNQGRNNYQFYTKSMNATALQRLDLENDLRKALDRGEFLLCYQPTVDVQTRTIIGAEALVRWKHPHKGMISPGEFIPLAEETGLIVPIGEWVLRTACSQNRAWQHAGHKPFRVAVNLSGRQFDQEGLIEVVSSALRDTGLDPQYLELEITESTIMKNPEKAATTLQKLKGMGICLSIDDFGTGYSSLGNLRKFPLDTLKIDRSFVMNITTDSDDAAITAAIIAMAHSLKLGVTAEGVESEDQQSFLRELGCDVVQGYLFSRPVPAEEFIKFVREKKHI